MTAYSVAINSATTLFAGQVESLTDVSALRVADKVVDFTTLTGSASTTADTLDVIALPPETLVDRGFIQVTQAATSGTTGTLALALVAPATTLVTGVANNATGYTMGSVTTTGGIIPPGTGTAISSQIYGTAIAPGGTTARLSFATAFGNPIIRVGLIYVDVSAVTVKVN